MSNVSPRTADPNVRLALIETAAHLLAEGGPAELSARRLASDVGVSTMAVYTHFGSMEELRRAVRREGFTRLAEHLGRVRPTSDPIVDISMLGGAYFANAVANPNLYRVMFIDPVPGTEDDDALAASTLEPLIDAVRRAVDTGRLSPGEPREVAYQLWAMNHGVVTLLLSGLFDNATAVATLTELGKALLVGLGGNRTTVTRSLNKARDRAATLARL